MTWRPPSSVSSFPSLSHLDPNSYLAGFLAVSPTHWTHSSLEISASPFLLPAMLLYHVFANAPLLQLPSGPCFTFIHYIYLPWNYIINVFTYCGSGFVSYDCSNKLHKHGGLKQPKCILAPFWRLEVQNRYHWLKSWYWQGHIPSVSSREESIPCLLQLLGASGIPWLMATPTNISIFNAPLHLHIPISSVCLSKLPLLSSFKDTRDCT